MWKKLTKAEIKVIHKGIKKSKLYKKISRKRNFCLCPKKFGYKISENLTMLIGFKWDMQKKAVSLSKILSSFCKSRYDEKKFNQLSTH